MSVASYKGHNHEILRDCMWPVIQLWKLVPSIQTFSHSKHIKVNLKGKFELACFIINSKLSYYKISQKICIMVLSNIKYNKRMIDSHNLSINTLAP